MSHYTRLSIYGNCTPLLKIKNKLKIGFFTNKVGKNCRYFVGVFNKTIILLVLVGYEVIIANSTLRTLVEYLLNIVLPPTNRETNLKMGSGIFRYPILLFNETP